MLDQYQQSVVSCTDSHIVCLAGAGTGKTHTLINRLNKLVSDGVSPNSMLVLTFTNAAAFEMKSRYLNQHKFHIYNIPEFRTFHSFCYHLICTDPTIRAKLNYIDIPQIADDIKYKQIEKSAALQIKCKLSQTKLHGKSKLTPKEYLEKRNFDAAVIRLLHQENLITFDILGESVCELFIKDDPCILKYKETYQYIFVDEFQDTDWTQWNFVKSFKNSSIYVCGDALQCQPANTQILMSDGTSKPIQDIKVGDHIIACTEKFWLESDEVYVTDTVSSIASRFADNIVEIKSTNHISQYTKDHITYTAFVPDKSAYAVYLMRNRDGWWRVGLVKWALALTGKNIYNILEYEHGTDIWVLSVVPNSNEAKMLVNQIKRKYKIPTISWLNRSTKKWSQMYKDLDKLETSVNACLNSYGRDINYPLQIPHDSFILNRVCNLIPHYMSIVIPDIHTNAYVYEPIVSIIDLPSDWVYSLNVYRYHNYIADNILTHNCIYQFRNADNSIIKQLTSDKEYTTLQLAKNYRSTHCIVEFANKYSEYSEYRIVMESKDYTGAPVEIKPYNVSQYMDVIDKNAIDDILMHTYSGTSAILCRTNKEVDAITSELERRGVAVASNQHTDREYTKNILRSVKDNQFLVDWISSMFTAVDYEYFIRQSVIQPEKSRIELCYNIAQHNISTKESIEKIFEIRRIIRTFSSDTLQLCKAICNVLHVNSDNLPDIKTFSELATYICTEDTTFDMYVGTVHSVKGLEYDNVYILGPNGPTWKLTSEDNKNLLYVAITRAKNNLVVYRNREEG